MANDPQSGPGPAPAQQPGFASPPGYIPQPPPGYTPPPPGYVSQRPPGYPPLASQLPVVVYPTRPGTGEAAAAPQRSSIVAGIAPSQSASDRRLAIVGGASVAVSLAAIAIRMLKLVPSSAAGAIVIIAGGIGLRVAVLFFARSATSPHRARVMMIISTVGLVISAVTLIATLPHATKLGGMGRFVADLMSHLWTLAVLTAAASPFRTLGWRAFVGTGLAGYLALGSLARLVGRPVVSAVGTNSVIGPAVWVPFTEEIIKALPVALIVILAARRTAARPSAFDMVLLGAWTGVGFAQYENTQFGRGGADWSAAPPFSLIFPSEVSAHVAGTTIVIAGHVVWTTMIGLGLGFGVLYRQRFRRAWPAIPVTFAVALAEHGAANGLGPAGPHAPLEQILHVLTLGGWLSSIVLIAGLVLVGRIEWEAVKPTAFRPAEAILLKPEVAAHRAQLLAVAQLTPQLPLRWRRTSNPAGGS